MKKSMILFVVDFTTEFGAASDKRKAHLAESSEDTFKNCLKKLPKWISKTWEVITFQFEGNEIVVSKEWLHETNFNWEQSHESNPIAE